MEDETIKNELKLLKKLFLGIFRQVEIVNENKEGISIYGSINFFHSRNTFQKHLKIIKDHFINLNSSQSLLNDNKLLNYLKICKEDKISKQNTLLESLKTIHKNYNSKKNNKIGENKEKTNESKSLREQLNEIAENLKIDYFDEENKFTYFADTYYVDINYDKENNIVEKIDAITIIDEIQENRILISKQLESYLHLQNYLLFENALFLFSRRESIFSAFPKLRKTFELLSLSFQKNLIFSFSDFLQIPKSSQSSIFSPLEEDNKEKDLKGKKYVESSKLENPFEICFYYFSDPVSLFQFSNNPSHLPPSSHSLSSLNKRKFSQMHSTSSSHSFPLHLPPSLDEKTSSDSNNLIKIENKEENEEKENFLSLFSYKAVIDLEEGRKEEEEPHLVIHFFPSIILPLNSLPLFFPSFNSVHSVPLTSNITTKYSSFFNVLLNKKHSNSFAKLLSLPESSFVVKLPSSPHFSSFTFTSSIWEIGGCVLSSIPLSSSFHNPSNPPNPSSSPLSIDTANITEDNTEEYTKEIEGILKKIKTFLTFNHLIKSFVDLRTKNYPTNIGSSYQCHIDLDPPNQIDLTLINPKSQNLFSLIIKLDSNNLPNVTINTNEKERFCSDKDCTNILQKSFSIAILLSFLYSEFDKYNTD